MRKTAFRPLVHKVGKHILFFAEHSQIVIRWRICQYLLLAIMPILAGCKATITSLPSGTVITSSTMVSPRSVDKNNGDYSDTNAMAILKQRFSLYQIHREGDTNVIDEVDLHGLDLKLTRQPFSTIRGHQSFAVASQADWAYPPLAKVAGSAKYEYLQEINLGEKDPQYELKYIVNPVELLRFQQLAEGRFTPIILFQRFVCAPSVLSEYKFQEGQSEVELAQILNHSALLSRAQRTDFSGLFVLRRYHKPEIVTSLLSNTHSMFEVTTNSSNLANGQKMVDAFHLKFRYGNLIYNLTPEYQRHLNSEGVWFDCSKLSEKQPAQPASKNSKQIKVPAPKSKRK